MVVARTISKKRYIVAFVITSLIFIVGLILGILVTQRRAESILSVSEIQKIDFDSLQTQLLFLNSVSKERNCPALTKTLEQNINDLEDTRRKLESYITRSLTESNQEFLLIKREYMLSEIRYWLLASESEKICDRDSVSILYFYSNIDCDDCVSQGSILTLLKNKFEENLLIFSIDADFEKEPIIPIIKEAYSIAKTPTLIIGDKKFEGLTKKEEVLKVICPSLKKENQECIGFENE